MEFVALHGVLSAADGIAHDARESLKLRREHRRRGEEGNHKDDTYGNNYPAKLNQAFCLLSRICNNLLTREL
jgi:hypothetical protein